MTACFHSRGICARFRPALLGLLLILLTACGSDGSESDGCMPGAAVCADESSYQVCGDDENWGAAVACNTGERCLQGVCSYVGPTDGDQECLVGQTVCVGELIQTCGSDGMWGTPVACSLEGFICLADSCVVDPTPNVCPPNAMRCKDTDTMETCSSDGSAWQETDCAEDEHCPDTQCVEIGTQICDPLVDTRCDNDGNVVHCNADGTGWENPESCQTGYRCYDGRCIDESTIVCDPGVETRCTDIGQLQVCNGDGTDWSDPFNCPGGFVCETDRCLERSCIPGEDFSCTDEGRIRYCNDTGDGYGEPQDCSPGLICVPDVGCSASQFVCAPNSYECVDAHSMRQCNDDGSDWLPGTVPCDAGTTGNECLNGECISLCELARQSDSYIGCEYWPVVLPNPQLDNTFKTGTESEFAVVVSNTNETYAASVTITHPTGSFSKTESVPAGSEKTIRLPYRETEKTYKGMNAYNLVSTIPVTVYQFNPIGASVNRACASDSTENPCFAHTNDASLLLPTHVLGTEYMAMAWRTPLVQRTITQFGIPGSPSQFGNNAPYVTIVGTQDNTPVTIHFRSRTVAGSGIAAQNAGNSYQTTLNRGEILQFVGIQDYSAFGSGPTCFYETSFPITGVQVDYVYCLGEEMSGTKINAEKPVAVYAGNECTFVPHNRWACDHLEQQLFPTETWTTSYIAGRMHPPLASHPNIYKIVALEDGTEITTQPNVNNQPVQYNTDQSCNRTLNAGDSCLIETSESFIVLSSAGHPVLVGQFLVGQDYHGVDGQSSSVGDPAFILVPPVEQFRYDYIFLIPDTYQESWVTLLATTGNPTVTFDGSPITGSWTQIGTVNAYRMEMPIDPGTYKVESSSRLGILVYGYDSYVSYAYPAGLDLSFTPY